MNNDWISLKEATLKYNWTSYKRVYRLRDLSKRYGIEPRLQIVSFPQKSGKYVSMQAVEAVQKATMPPIKLEPERIVIYEPDKKVAEIQSQVLGLLDKRTGQRRSHQIAQAIEASLREIK